MKSTWSVYCKSRENGPLEWWIKVYRLPFGWQCVGLDFCSSTSPVRMLFASFSSVEVELWSGILFPGFASNPWTQFMVCSTPNPTALILLIVCLLRCGSYRSWTMLLTSWQHQLSILAGTRPTMDWYGGNGISRMDWLD